jgi:hypothetical protein
VRRKERNVFSVLACANARYAFCKLVVRLGIESDTFEVLTALVARKALGVEAQASCGDDPTGDGQSALRTECALADISRRPMGARIGSNATAKRL